MRLFGPSSNFVPASLVVEDVTGFPSAVFCGGPLLRALLTPTGLGDLHLLRVLTEENLPETGNEEVESLFRCGSKTVLTPEDFLESLTDAPTADDIVTKIIDSAADIPPGSRAVVLIQATPLLFHFPLFSVARSLVRLRGVENVALTIVSIHGDCHGESAKETLRGLVDASIIFRECNLDAGDSSIAAQCVVRCFKSAARNGVWEKLYHVSSEDFCFRPSPRPFAKGGKDNAGHVAEDDDEALKLQTTFKLSLNPAEKEAKDRVKLPFWRPEQLQTGQGQKGGQIIYVADEGDDQDEEDPDDELNI